MAAACAHRGSWKRTISNTSFPSARTSSAGRPVKRNFVHVIVLVSAFLLAIDHPKARQQLFNICMDEPVDYGEMDRYLNQSRGFATVGIKTPYHSTWLDNAKAKFLLGWQPQYDLKKI